MSVARTLKEHWPEYLIEGWALAMFMVSASCFTIWLENPGMPLRRAIANDDLRRVLIGVAMGATAIALIYSPWGKRSGAHMNPAVTLAFLSLHKVAPWDAFFYVIAQFVGGSLGVVAVWIGYGAAFSAPPVSFIATMPGIVGTGIAFLAEFSISLATMSMILFVSSSATLARYTGLIAGLLIASYVTFESPLSGFSMNPARTFASAFAGGAWTGIWIYFTAPPLGMWAATRIYKLARISHPSGQTCAKLQHPATISCIHCGYSP